MLIHRVTKELHPIREALATTRDLTSHTFPCLFKGRFFEAIRDIGIPDNIDPSAALALDIGKNYFLCIVIEGSCPGHWKAMNNNGTIIDLTVKVCWRLRMLRADAL